jgi:DNA-binding PucR family transcriptional regulator
LRDAATLAYRLGRRGRVPVSELFVEVLLSSSPETVASFKEDLLEPLRARDRRNAADLLATMRAHLEHDLSRSATAAALHIHVNTLDGRLARIRALTGIDLTTTAGVVRASLALKAEALSTGR